MIYQLLYYKIYNILSEGESIMDKTDISKVLKELRRALELTQEQFAAKIGVTFTTINRWENKRGKPSPLAMKRIEALRQELNVSQQKSLSV
jgi:DNA-binding transcriptional regulator YiaG